MTLIIPGVEISVIRELVPRPLGATGVLGIAGCTELDLSNQPLQAYGSLQEFRAAFGAGSLMSMPEVVQAFSAGLNQVVVANIPPGNALAARADVAATVDDNAPVKLRFTARASGAWGNQLLIRLISRRMGSEADDSIEVQVFMLTPGDKLPVKVEALRNLSCRQGNERFFGDVIKKESAFITTDANVGMSATAKVLPNNTDPDAPLIALSAGEDPNQAAYQDALARLEVYPEIDMVTVSHRFGDNEAKATAVYADVLSHCDRMSRIARNRIGFGQTVPESGKPNVQPAVNMASKLPSERFILVAPYGYMGSVIGMIAGLRYFDSPTYKTLGGVSDLTFDYTDSHLISLISAGVCAVDEVPRKGISCVKGITTDTGQINVTRVADRSVRQVQNIAQDFIGLLNTEEQRLALKQRIIEAFTRMEKEGAIVPSTDGKSPAFAVSVESAPDDFAAGIVRIGTAVRPVRAIDYIYATVMVQAF